MIIFFLLQSHTLTHSHTEMTDFSLTSASLQSNTILYLHLRKKCMTKFFLHCVFFFSSSLLVFYSTVSFTLTNFVVYSNVTHDAKSERKRKQLSELLHCFYFYFSIACPFLSRSSSVVLLFFLLPCTYRSVRYVQIEIWPAQTHGSFVRCSYTFIVSIDAFWWRFWFD